jgi:predicted RND superfamily exporter protein
VSGALQGTLYAFVLVSAPSLRMLWRLRESLLALPPLVLALAWTIGLMHRSGSGLTWPPSGASP